jgi:hypothetical protein
MQPDFSAAQSVWRRDRDSNLHYLLCRTAKNRRVRDLQRILQLTRLIRRMAWTPELGKVNPSSGTAERRTLGDGVTET